MDYFKEISNLKPRKESLSSMDSTSSTNSFYKALNQIEEEDFIPLLEVLLIFELLIFTDI